MKIALFLGGGIVALFAIAVVLAIIIGASLPVAHRVSKSATFAVAPEKLWQDSLTTFNRTNDGSFAIVAQNPPTQLVTEIVKKDLPYGGRWTFDFVPGAEGTTLTITEDGKVYNAFFRFMSRFVFGYESSIDAFFAALRKELAKPAAELGSARRG